jgi:DNA-binding MarR family transcriptional regulator
MKKSETAGAADVNVWNLCTNAAIKRASRRLGQLYEDVLRPSGLRGTQFSLLTQIMYQGEPTLRELAGALVMDLSALGHTLKPLERDGLVKIVPDEADRRARRVRLTRKGAARQAEAAALWQAAQARFDAEFGADRSSALRQTLERISSDDFAERFTGTKKAAR